MKLTLRILLWMLLLVIVPVGAVVLLQPTFDLSGQRDRVATFASALADRDIRIGGQLRLALGRHARLEIGKLAISNPDWADDPDLFSAAEVAAVVDLAGLIGGKLVFEEIRLRDARLALEASIEGQRSWDFGTPVDQQPARGDPPGPGLLSLSIESGSLDNVEVVYSAPRVRHLLVLEHFRQRNDNGMLLLDGKGQLNGLAARLAGRIGTLEALLNGKDIAVDLSASLDDTVWRTEGRLGDIVRGEDIELTSTLRGPDLAHILEALGIAYRHAGEIDTTLTIADEAEGLSWQLSGRLGAMRLSSAGRMRDPDMVNGVEADFDVSGKDLATLASALGYSGMPGHAFRLRGGFRRYDSDVRINDLEFRSGADRLTLDFNAPSYPRIVDAAAGLSLAVENPALYAGVLGVASLLDGRIRLDAELKRSGEGQQQLTTRGSWAGHELKLDGQLQRDSASRVKFQVAGPDLPIEPVDRSVAYAPLPYLLAGQFDVDGKNMIEVTLADSTIGSARLKLDGVVGRWPELDGMQLSLGIEGQSLDGLAGRFTATSLPQLPFSLATQLSGNLAAVAVRDPMATLADAELKTRGSVVFAKGLAGTDLRFDLVASGLAQLLGYESVTALGREPVRSTGRIRVAGGAILVEEAEVRSASLNASLSASIPVRFELAGATMQLDAKATELAAVLPATAAYVPPSESARLLVDAVSRANGVDITDARLEIGASRVTASGSLLEGESGIEGRINLEGSVSRLAELGQFGSITLPDDPLSMQGVIRFAGPRVALEQLRLVSLDASIEGSVTYEKRERPFVDVDLVARQIDTSRYKAATVTTTEPPQADPAIEPGQRIPSAVIDLGVLQAFDGHIVVRGEELSVPDPRFPGRRLVRTALLDADLSEGTLTVNHLDIDGDRGKLQSRGQVSAVPEPSIDWQGKGSNLRFGVLATGEGLDSLPAHEVDMQLSAKGSTYRAMASSLGGRLRLTGGSGQTFNAGLDTAMGSFFNELFNKLNPFAKSESHTRIDCTAAAVRIENGVIALSPGIVIRSDKVDIAASGTVDLRTEGLDIHFHVAPRKGVGISAVGVVQPYIKVGGSLVKPGITLDTPNAVLSGTAAVATSGLSILGTSLYNRLSTLGDPCKDLIERADSEPANAGLNVLKSIEKALGQPARSKPSQDPPGTGASVLDLAN